MKRTELRRKKPMKGAVLRPAHTDKYLAQRAQAADTQRKQRKVQQDWTRSVRTLRGNWCRAKYSQHLDGVGPCEGEIQSDHIWERSQQGPYTLENGGPLCRRHHEMKTKNRLQWRYEWLDLDQITWFARVGFVAWDRATGEPYGPGMRTFAPLSEAQLAAAIAADRIPLLQR